MDDVWRVPDDAIRRELAEELGVQGVEPALLFKSRYHDAEINWWACCYKVIWDRPIHLQEEEIAWGRFMSEAELTAQLDQLPFVPDGWWPSDGSSTSQTAEP